MSATTIIGTKTMAAGTPGFQAPEQLKAESIGIHCDVYAFGCVITTTLQERVLWPGLGPFQILCKVTVANEKPDMSGLSAEFLSIVDKCLTCVQNRSSSKQVLGSLLSIARTRIAKFHDSNQ